MTIWAALLVGILGLAIGSFLNVVIYRVPRDMSVVTPRSHCPACESGVRPRDEVPVLSWLLLRGRCRDCKVFISPRYAFVELLTGVLFVALTLKFGLSAELPAYLYLASVCIALALIDLDTQRLPDVLTKPSYVIGLVLLGFAAVAGHHGDALLRAVIAMALLFAAYFVLRVAYPPAMGFGDVKLAGVLGLYLGWLGWGSLLIGSFGAFVLGAAVVVTLIVAGKARRRNKIPFGPFMVTAALLAVFFGQALTTAYVNLSVGS
jgi:leader peptidase (prepilin peptidase)/N-methyltransferase